MSIFFTFCSKLVPPSVHFKQIFEFFNLLFYFLSAVCVGDIVP